MTDQTGPEDTCRPVDVDGETIRVRGQGELTPEGEDALAALVRAAKAKFVADAPGQVGVLQNRLRLAHQARRAKEHQLDDIRRALCDIGFMEDDDPYSHADLADVVRQNGRALSEMSEADRADADDLTTPSPAATETAESPLRDLIATAIGRTNLSMWHKAARYEAADAVLAAILPSAHITATLARMSEADVQRVIALYERWVKAGPPPLGVSVSRWWDARLIELRATIHPPETDDTTNPTTALIPQDRALERVEALAYRWETALPADLPYARSLRAALAGPSEPS